MVVHKLKDTTVSLNEDGTFTIVLPTNPVIALKISMAEHFAMQERMLEVLTEQNKIAKDLIKIVRENVKGD